MHGCRPCLLRFIWYLIIGLLAGTVAKYVTQVHLGFGRTVLLGVAGSLIGGLIARLFSRTPPDRPFHPAGCLLSILGAIIIIWIGAAFGGA
jgi:uncharacterized membrane protein YeaQ/YmgE (transglycosylase-associated protein family)